MATVEVRALQSAGASEGAIYQLVAEALAARAAGGVLLDVGCGRGALRPHVADRWRPRTSSDNVLVAGRKEGPAWT